MTKKKKGYVYLGKRVKDTGKPGLDSVREVLGIVRAIMLDYRLKRISKKLAMRRLSILKLAVMRDRDFKDTSKREKALKYIDNALQELRRSKKKRRGLWEFRMSSSNTMSRESYQY